MIPSSTKHYPGRKTQLPPSNAPLRSVTISAATIPDASIDYVSLGSREPADGRYVSLVRSNFQHRAVQSSGEQLVEPMSAEQITIEKQQRTLQNRERQYYLGPPGDDDELSRFMNTTPSIGRGTPSPALLSRSQCGTPPVSSYNPEEVRKNAGAMRQCHVFVSSKDQQGWKDGSASTMRSDIGKNVATANVISVQDRTKLRDAQRSTHFALGFNSDPVTSEARGQFRGEPAARLHALRLANSTLQLGMSSVDVKDTLQSLKQVDFKPTNDAIREMRDEKTRHALAGTNRNVVNAETDSLVLGYAEHKPGGADKNSLYRVSFTPVHFEPSPHRASRQ
ncbi:Hypothetical protein, putative [Bodo saltans]|uniref:Uncharacterized protein n=1 Tax=Bodo saltans TaxID=75058 RepID=A0A0S4ISY4_BODSA|nr:Hypothetical protein, putative [Bodo saltans]|eukprot:CUF74279.1 Hypothetical protein, putative [Bodo saltans]